MWWLPGPTSLFFPSLQWRFTFSHFVVEPGQEYEVTVHHLPKPIPDGDPNHKSRNFPVPGKSPSSALPLTFGSAEETSRMPRRQPPCLAGQWLPSSACGTHRTQMPGTESSLRCGCSLCSLEAEPILCWHKQWILAQDPRSFKGTGVPLFV